MAKATVYSIVLTPELHDAFLAAAAACDRPPAQVLRGLMREFVQRQQEAAAAAEAAEAAPDAEATAATDVTAVTEAPAPAPTAAPATAPAAPAAAPVAAAPTEDATEIAGTQETSEPAAAA